MTHLLTEQELAEFDQWRRNNPDNPDLKILLECAELFFSGLIQAKQRIR